MQKKVTDYLILIHNDHQALQRNVIQFIADRFEPFGSLSVTLIGNDPGGYPILQYSQAVVKYEY